ncbi:MAG: hypothetical protein JO119_13270, partial [Acidobacteria bacterium]|nr:hypothetical protein [Acidobacteriota bacterium]
MSRAYTGAERRAVAEEFSAGINISQNHHEAEVPEPVRGAPDGEPWLLRGGLALVVVALCWSLKPFGLHGIEAVGTGVLLATIILATEMRLRRATPSGLLGGALGAVLGIFAAVLVTAVVSRIAEPEQTKSFFESGVLVAFAYLGAVLGSQKAVEREVKRGEKEELSPAVSGTRDAEAQEADSVSSIVPKLLDTSVLIDGRIGDVCEAQFLDGPL